MCTKITGQAMYVRRNNEGRSRNHCCDGKTISITYSECVFVALLARKAHAPYYIVCDLSGHAIILHVIFLKVTIFREALLNTKCVFRFPLQILSDTFLILRRTERDVIKNVCRSSCKVPVIVVRC